MSAVAQFRTLPPEKIVGLEKFFAQNESRLRRSRIGSAFRLIRDAASGQVNDVN